MHIPFLPTLIPDECWLLGNDSKECRNVQGCCWWDSSVALIQQQQQQSVTRRKSALIIWCGADLEGSKRSYNNNNSTCVAC